ncbi:PEP-CTERM domain protein [Polymorphobacter glacialis]|uniref:PEP-CTERM domain protein n=2 Tax=Sandarakinorhabdus glacialis TaxID=1614636 RepID=A0A917E416_9SPHN|nr:PEP-CTERM domain protein [Polymorphobacter glacialis]
MPNPGTVQFFDFTVGAASNVTLRSWSYAGGVNAAGQTIARGGFDPILALFALPGGGLVGQNDDGGASLVAADAVSGRAWDTFFSAVLDPGLYRVSVMVYPNFAPGNVFTGTFAGASTFADVSGTANNPRSNEWAFDILGVESAVQNGVPEPASWALLIAGFGLTGAAMRRRRRTMRSVTG